MSPPQNHCFLFGFLPILAAWQAMEKLAANKSWAGLSGPDGGVDMGALLSKK
jgi:hypothetical protein